MTTIEWTDKTWNPVSGCTKVSQGCKNCYAERVFPRAYAKDRVEHPNGGGGWTSRPRAFTEIRTHPDRLDQPLHWRKPARVFVNSMSDLFHGAIPDNFILDVWDVMRECVNGYSARTGRLTTAHVFQILTKRPERMMDFCSRLRFDERFYLAENASAKGYRPILRTVWLGVSVEDQATADERIPLLLQTPAAVRFVSYEPALGPVDFRYLQPGDPPTEIDALNGTHGVIRPHGGTGPRLDWIIVGGESGPRARPFDLAWARSTIAQCKAAGVACFVKQMGAKPEWRDPSGGEIELRDRKGGDMSEWPKDLRVREFPQSA